MTAMTYLWRHPDSGIYWFRRGVPVELRPGIGKREIKKSLGTTSLPEAKRRGMEVAAEVDRLFETARNGVTLTLADAEALAAAWKAEALAEHADKVATSAEGPSPDQTARVVALLDQFKIAARKTLASRPSHIVIGDHTWSWEPSLTMADDAKAILRKQGIALRETDPGFRRLCFALHKALIEVGDVLSDRTQGVWRNETQAPTPVIITPALSPLATVMPRRRPRVDGKPDATLLEIIKRWDKENRPTPRSLQWAETAVRRFNESVGVELIAREITKQHVIKFLDDLALMPRTVPTKLRGKPLPVILKAIDSKSGVKRLSPPTVIKQFGMLHTLLKFARKYDFADGNVAEDLKPHDPTSADEKRFPFDAADLKLIFERSAIYRGCESARRRRRPGSLVIRDARFWLPLLSLYTGARIDELGQLLVTDVKMEEGVAFIDLNTVEEGKRLKNKGSRRKVPLHPELVNCGFLEYVAAVRKKGERQVFPELRINKEGRWTGNVASLIVDDFRALGITDRLKVVHSFRHTFKDACRDAEIPEEVHDRLTGHRNGSVGRDYGGRNLLQLLARAIAKISYPIDLSHLHDR
jgi:integrase